MDAITCWCCDRLVMREASIYITRSQLPALQPQESLGHKTMEALLTMFAAFWVLLQLGLRIGVIGLFGYALVLLAHTAQKAVF